MAGVARIPTRRGTDGDGNTAGATVDAARGAGAGLGEGVDLVLRAGVGQIPGHRCRFCTGAGFGLCDEKGVGDRRETDVRRVALVSCANDARDAVMAAPDCARARAYHAIADGHGQDEPEHEREFDRYERQSQT